MGGRKDGRRRQKEEDKYKRLSHRCREGRKKEEDKCERGRKRCKEDRMKEEDMVERGLNEWKGNQEERDEDDISGREKVINVGKLGRTKRRRH